MNLPNKTFCILPWVSLEATPMGTIRPCCLADDTITDQNGQAYTLTKNTLSEARTSKDMDLLRSQFLQGERPDTCRKCWDEEDAGCTSKRMHTIKRLKHIVDDSEWTQEAKPLMFLDLKLGNICNLSCRICGSWSSSTYAAEEIATYPTTVKKYTLPMQKNRDGAWPRTSEQFWIDLKNIASEIRYLEFTGGEPFMIKEHFAFLQYLVDADIASNIEIHYNTNGTQWPEKYIDLWKHFKHVEIAFSIDNISVRFEYERTGANWAEVNKTIDRFIQLRKKCNNISLQLCCTINVYNVLYLESIVNWDKFEEFDFMYWNMLHDSPEDCIKSLPDNAKDVVSDKLLMADVDDKTLEEFKNIVSFMYSGSGAPKEELLKKIKRLDERRGHSLRVTHPDLYDLLYEYDQN